MTPEQILAKAIEKAIAGGWELTRWLQTMYLYEPNKGYISPKIAPMIIYNHDFAKALWPNSNKWLIRIFTPTGMQLSGQEVWEWEVHLQQMVIADDPIAYLGDNLPA